MFQCIGVHVLSIVFVMHRIVVIQKVMLVLYDSSQTGKVYGGTENIQKKKKNS